MPKAFLHARRVDKIPSYSASMSHPMTRIINGGQGRSRVVRAVLFSILLPSGSRTEVIVHSGFIQDSRRSDDKIAHQRRPPSQQRALVVDDLARGVDGVVALQEEA